LVHSVTDTLLKLRAAAKHLDLQAVGPITLDFNPGILLVEGTLHLRSRGSASSFDRFD
jgi:hypothetical protein